MKSSEQRVVSICERDSRENKPHNRTNHPKLYQVVSRFRRALSHVNPPRDCEMSRLLPCAPHRLLQNFRASWELKGPPGTRPFLPDRYFTLQRPPIPLGSTVTKVCFEFGQTKGKGRPPRQPALPRNTTDRSPPRVNLQSRRSDRSRSLHSS